MERAILTPHSNFRLFPPVSSDEFRGFDLCVDWCCLGTLTAFIEFAQCSRHAPNPFQKKSIVD